MQILIILLLAICYLGGLYSAYKITSAYIETLPYLTDETQKLKNVAGFIFALFWVVMLPIHGLTKILSKLEDTVYNIANSIQDED
jgi:hypothetical protein